MRDCPTGCGTRIDESLLLCSEDWRLVPQRLRGRIKAAYAGGRGVNTPEYDAAIGEAIAAVTARSAVAA